MRTLLILHPFFQHAYPHGYHQVQQQSTTQHQMRLVSQPIQHSQPHQLTSAAAAAVAATASTASAASVLVPHEAVQATTSHLSNEFYQHYAANIATFNHMYKHS